MAAQTKSELLDVTEKEFAKLEKLIADIARDDALSKDDDDTSIKDIVAHRAHWIDLFLGWYHDGLAGKDVYFPAKGYKWNQLKAYNADLRAKQKNLSWKKACDELHEAHQKLLNFISETKPKALYGGPMKGADNDWTPGRWAEAAGPSHYRSACKYIRARMKQLKT
ncbi:MAG: ClbS/DfsB family four-helix bundle protein [Pseudomonadota bacterium]